MKTVFLFVCFISTILSHENPISPQESFFLRRIAEFWKDKDYALVKQQITEHLEKYPESAVRDNLYAILGDLYFQEGNFSEALAAYRTIVGKEFQGKTLYRHVQSLYELEEFQSIITTALPFFSDSQRPKIDFREEVQFVLAESLFKEVMESQDLLEETALQAKELYQSFSSEQYKTLALHPLAEIHRLLDEYPQAATLYALLAEKYPEKAEDFLFQAGALQLAFDQNAAIDTYAKISSLGGSKASESAYNQFVLLFQNEKYADFVEKAQTIEARLTQENLPLFHFCLGKSLFLIDNYTKAVAVLESYLKESEENSDERKSAFLTLVSCSQKMNDAALFDRTLEELIAAYPNDSDAAKALLLHAQSALKKENSDQALQDLNRLISSFPDFEDLESVMYDYALLLAQNKNWAKSRENFLALVEKFPDASHADLAWSYILNCSMNELKESADDMRKKQLANDLRFCLERDTLFSEEERPVYQFLLGKTLFEIDDKKGGIAVLENHLRLYPTHVTAGESHLLLALSNPDPAFFAFHAEEALSADSNIVDKGALHLQLFNAYLNLQQFDKAAEHLFESHIGHSHPIQNENRLWLANYYFDVKDLDRATLLFQKLLKIEDDSMQIQIDPHNPFLEIEALKLASILSPQKKLLLLSSLANLQQKNPDIGWKFQRQTLFDLGKAYEELHQFDQAVQTFDILSSSPHHAPSYFSTAAMLEKVRLLYTTCSEQERSENNPKMVQILSALKDLQIQKKVISEPLHLEAALEYVDIRTSLAPPEKRLEATHFFLNRIKEDYTSTQDGANKEYSEARRQYPEKETTYQIYMKCIEAEMSRIEALLAKKENNVEREKQSEAHAAALFKELLADKKTTPYLRSRIEINLKALGR